MRSPALCFVALLAACSENQSVIGGGFDASATDTTTAPDSFDVTRAPDVIDASLAPDVVDVSLAPDVVDAPPPDVPFRCAARSDCAGRAEGPACDTTTGRCVACTAADDACPAGQYCDATMNRCASGCRDDNACAAAAGDAGASTTPRCNPTTRACVACLVDTHCPPGTLCVGELCVPGCSATQSCPAGQSCCGGACVDPQRNPAHCGGCGMNCTVPNAAPACANGTCAVGMCTGAFADCDRTAANGCETNTQTAVDHCGACGAACAARTNATAACEAGVCRYACAAGFADCDGDPANGCETNTGNSVGNCGRCGALCNPPNGSPSCNAGVCGINRCTANFDDCDRNATNGCEVDTRTAVSHCGACNNACPPRPNGVPACANGTCAVTCVAGFAECDGNAANGCEVALPSDPMNCGACNNRCAFANAAASCSAGSCILGTCATGFANCDNTAANGCEADTRTSTDHCGACNNRCGANQVCRDGACTILASCAQLRTQFPSLPSGEYEIDPDGPGGAAAFRTFCEMGIDNGGWTWAATVHNFPATAGRRWTSLEALSNATTFGTLAGRLTDNVKAPAWSTLPATDLLVVTDEYHFGFRGLLGNTAFGPYIRANYPTTACNTRWTRSGADFVSSNLNATQRGMFGFVLGGQDVNGGGGINSCFPGTNENSAVSFLAGPAWWVNGIANCVACAASWNSYDLSLLRLVNLVPTSCNPATWPCSASGVWPDESRGNGDPSVTTKSRYALVYVR